MNEPSKLNDETSHPTVDTAEVIRRLDNLWLDRPAKLTGPFSDPVGTKVGRYVLQRVIGRGAFGIVYKAHDPDLNRPVAIKIPRPDVLLDSDRLARFESEVQACARLDHPGIVPLYEADLSRAVPYMASAYCPGPNLQQWMDEADGPCSIDAAVIFIEKVARAVQYAHENGIVHRDLKPGNILLVPNDPDSSSLTTLNDFQPRLTDFGLAQMTHGLHESQSSLIIGTPLYMSPEQAESRSDDIGPASDVFGLGAILYHLLTGVAPYAARNYAAVLLRLREETPVPVSALRADVDADLETVCLKCLQRDPADRYVSAVELADDLLRCRNRQPIQGRRLSLLQRARRWSMQSARINEATILIVVLAFIRLLFGPGALIMALASQDVSVTRMEIMEIFLANILVIMPNDLWTIWAARRNLANRSSTTLYWSGLAASVIGSVFMILISMGIAPASEWYRRSLGARILVFGLMAMIFYAQTIGWYLADWSRQEGSRLSFRRRNLKLLLLSIPVIVAFAIPTYRYAQRHSEPPQFTGPVQSIEFDGAHDSLSVDNIGFESRSPVTLEAWVQPDRPHRGAIASHGPISLTVVAAGEGNRFRVHVSASESLVYLLDAKSVFAINSWTHVAMTYDGNEIRLYVNGQLQEMDVAAYEATTNQVIPNQSLPNPFLIDDLWPGSKFMIGNIRQTDSGTQFHFSGRIGELRLIRSVYYHEEFEPQSTLATAPETVLLFHLQDGVDQVSDATGQHVAIRNQ